MLGVIGKMIASVGEFTATEPVGSHGHPSSMGR